MEAVHCRRDRRAGHRLEDHRRPAAACRQEVRRQGGAAPQGRRGVGRHLLHRARRGGQGGRARPDRPRHRAGRQGLDPRPHAPRVDARLLRHPHRRRHARHDLPDELARGVPVRARALRLARDLRRGRRAAREGPRGRGQLPGAASTSSSWTRRTRTWATRISLDAAARARPRPRRVRVGGALPGRHARGHLPLHLHVGHHRAAQGLPALARELPRDHRRGGRPERRSSRATRRTSSCRSPTRSRS